MDLAKECSLFGVKISDMSKNELLIVVGWFAEQNKKNELFQHFVPSTKKRN
jgi:hypothetical protein